MKQLTFILTILILVGCKKDDTPEPTPTPATFLNHINFNGTEIQISNTDTARYWLFNSHTCVVTDNPNVSLALMFPGSDTGSYHMVGNQPNVYNNLWVNGEGYSHPDWWITISQYDTIGGRIIGTFEGTVKQNSDTTVILPVSGAFNVLRGDDI